MNLSFPYFGNTCVYSFRRTKTQFSLSQQTQLSRKTRIPENYFSFLSGQSDKNIFWLFYVMFLSVKIVLEPDLLFLVQGMLNASPFQNTIFQHTILSLEFRLLQSLAIQHYSVCIDHVTHSRMFLSVVIGNAITRASTRHPIVQFYHRSCLLFPSVYSNLNLLTLC